ncbi:MAG TPA: thymidine phosphorylase [Holophagaceae bacterium]|jgi:pyrimidine-nucleoside phosphorylase|nr:thymidine phosphorylase [Holophagaceae bacterium]
MRAYDLIYRKKMGGELDEDQIRWWVEGVTAGALPPEQSAALLMAICWRGMSTAETLALTLAMRDSGARLDLSSVPGVKVDKHSTGGVGDKATLILGPIVAACGVPCAMFSGRGLGHTGGTIDKFSAIPGLRVELSEAEFLRSLRETGFANSAQTAAIAPADRKLYALRDVTATVESIPLITASIMSKKLAGGAEALVLDVKCGGAAFMKTREEAEALAKSMVAVGKAHGMKIKALITRMEEPLGWAIGNALEVMESVEILRGQHGDSVLARLSFRFAAEMLVVGGGAESLEVAEHKVTEAVATGRALEVLKRFVALNGGDAAALEDFSRLPQPARQEVIRADRGGFVTAIDGRALGIVAMELGAGRRELTDTLDLGVGLRIHAPVGTRVKKDDPLATTLSGSLRAANRDQVLSAFSLSTQAPAETHWLMGIVE